jgi:hypothetical protein
MEKEQTTLGFEINYSGRVLFCEALLMVDSYAIFLNNKYMAEIEYDASAGWVQTNGIEGRDVRMCGCADVQMCGC